jgi:hypothetical protein
LECVDLHAPSGPEARPLPLTSTDTGDRQAVCRSRCAFGLGGHVLNAMPAAVASLRDVEPPVFKSTWSAGRRVEVRAEIIAGRFRVTRTCTMELPQS